MQIGVGGPCGTAGDEYDSLRQVLPDPSLGAHDPMTAVSLAALVLIKDKAVPTAPDPHGTFIATSALPAPDSLSRCRPAWRWAAQCLSHGIL
jgi:hypothetical protein